jgi:hypothetical protein
MGFVDDISVGSLPQNSLRTAFETTSTITSDSQASDVSENVSLFVVPEQPPPQQRPGPKSFKRKMGWLPGPKSKKANVPNQAGSSQTQDAAIEQHSEPVAPVASSQSLTEGSQQMPQVRQRGASFANEPPVIQNYDPDSSSGSEPINALIPNNQLATAPNAPPDPDPSSSDDSEAVVPNPNPNYIAQGAPLRQSEFFL